MTRAGIIAVIGMLAMGLSLLCTGLAVTRALQPVKPVPRPAAAGWVEVRVRPPSHDSFRAKVYYPAVAPGGGAAALDLSGAPYPAIVFGHGYLATPTSYHETLRRLAVEGYIVIAPETRRILFPDHSKFADNMLAALTWLTEESEQPATLFTDAIRADGFGAAGHSTGGGAALLAAARDPRVVAVSTFAAADTEPSSLDVVGHIRGPVQFVCGSDDGITPLDEHQRPLFRKVTAAKQLVVFKGGSHCGFLDEDPPLGESGSMDREKQLELARGLMAAWFAVHLKGDEIQRAGVYSPSPDPRVSVKTVPAAR